MFQNLPEKYKNPFLFVIVAFLFSQIIPILSSLFNGEVISFFGCRDLLNTLDLCHSIIPTKPYEFGKFLGSSSAWIIGALVIYWWEIARKNKKD